MNRLTIESIEAFGNAAQAALDANARAFLTLAEGENFCPRGGRAAQFRWQRLEFRSADAREGPSLSLTSSNDCPSRPSLRRAGSVLVADVR
jgi:hypothetical protein